ncbi:unnamed protein product (macronuclear) [Paramecium tetraurelia]|uniref:Transmembrane protein n=1 Tax=Paramecium tetraurelia TaxID=5888 RepID=A0DNR8_PARTE|nr:uncharacterized protein GSPATT00018881001 [Paramecium tetraurelia]CAK84685.1 unnamed protein product [Paramecium tetraurelia]|eukprot:XP_001452082.1 hypothetical protein (macronuclear) [Paramecium tetraurelia strain d4-2]
MLTQGFEVYEQTSESNPNIIYRPINQGDGLIYDNISTKGKDYLDKHIKLYNYFIVKLKERQNQEQTSQSQQQKAGQEQGKDEGQLSDMDDFIKQQFNVDDIVNSLINQIQNNPYPQQTEIILRQQINKQIFQFEQIDDNSVTFCLLYDNQEISEINSQIATFKDIFPKESKRKINIVILINGKENCKNFDPDLVSKINVKENECNICYTYEYNKCIFLVINEEQSTIRLLNWIYRGIFKHFQSQYFYVGYLSIQIGKEKFIYMDEMIMSPKYCGATGYYNLIHVQNENKILTLNYSFVGYMNYLNYQFQIDSLAELKRFHDPFFAYYKWNELYNDVDSYIKELESENQKGNLNLHLNSVLPFNMFKKSEKKYFFSAASNLGEKKIIQDNQAQMFLDLSNLMYNITQCNDFALNKHSLMYAILLDLRKFESKIKLAQILFLYTFSPYQLYFYSNSSRSYLKIIIAIVCPFFLFILLLFFVLLVQQYQIGVTIVKKKVRDLILLFTKNELQILFKSKIKKLDKNQMNSKKEINFEIEQKNYKFENLYKELPTQEFEEWMRDAQSSHVQHSSTDNNINEGLMNDGNDEQNSKQVRMYKLSIQSISEKKVDNFYEKLFKYTFFAEILCSAAVIGNLIYTYGRNLVYDVQDEQHFVTIFGILIFIAFFIIRNFGIKTDQCWVSLLVPIFIFLNLLITTVYSEMYHLLRIQIKPKEYLEQVQKLSQYLCLNIFFLIIFYIVETSMNFQGYIFSIIIFYNLTLYLIDSLIVLGAILNGKYNKSIQSENTKKEGHVKKNDDEKQEDENKKEEEKKEDREKKIDLRFQILEEDYKSIVDRYIKDLRMEQQKQNENTRAQIINHKELIVVGEAKFSHDPANLNNSSEIFEK